MKPLAGLLLLLTACSSTPAADPGWSDSSDGVRFHIWTDRPSYRSGEEIVLHAEFENVGSEPRQILISTPQAPLLDLERILLTSNDSNDAIELVPAEKAGRVNRILGPGTRYPESGRLTSWRTAKDEPLRLTPGVWLVQAIYSNASKGGDQKVMPGSGLAIWTGTLRSNVVRITIVR